MSIISSGFSAIGRLAALAVLLAVFLFGLVGVVYMSLQGNEIKVPEITGKDLHESEKELALLGLKIKKRADRVSAEKPDTVIEQLPKAGETVKTGQMILVVTSKGGGEGDVPPSLKTTDEDDLEKIEEMISDKPKKPKANSNTTRKKADTARDVNSDSGNSSNSNSNSNSSEPASNKKEPGTSNNSSDKPNKNAQTPTTPKPNPGIKPADAKPKPATKP
ncbi:MAG: PASTA domain-containing protein [Pyrinomonadaceae bacterium]